MIRVVLHTAARSTSARYQLRSTQIFRRAMSVIPTGPIAIRPPFPSGWAYLNLGIDDCDLANILPVGQSFLWHRHQLQITTTELTKVEAVESEIAYTSGSTAGPSDDEAAPADIIEEFSRAIDNPPRVILLRQSVARRRVYYTSVAPTDIARSTGNPTAYEREEVDEKWMNDYFQLERVIDLPALYASWIRGDTDLFARTLGDEEADRLNGLYFGHGSRSERVEHMAGRGIRVLSQDPWECLIAFITSTNNHIPRIAGLMHRLSTHFSSPLLSLPTPGAIPPPPSDPAADIAEGTDSALHDPTPLTTYHLFPTAASLAPVGEEASLEPVLRELGFGYRAGFLASSLATLRARFGAAPGEVEKGLMGLRRMNEPEAIEEVREVLLELKGIGRKVADCVLLMCLGQDSVIPIDTHVAAIAARHPSFPSRLKNKPMSPPLYNEVQQFLAARWGDMGGWAQAVMFALDLPDTTVDKGAKGGSAASTPTKTPSRTPSKNKLKRADSGTPTKVKVEAKEDEAEETKRKVDGMAEKPAFKRTRSSARLEAQHNGS